MVEAMNLGIPVIATGYSGNMEFCNEETCWLVDYDLRPLDRDEYIFVSPGQKWAEPRLESAVRRMRDVFHDGDKRGARAAAAKRFVGERFSPAAISARYAARLAEIFSSLGLNANVSAETSSRRSVRRRRSGSPDDLRAGGSVHLGG
jgi:glycosyltransferase involved in cell wall biosynthesis